jgi:N-acetyl-gamma-glutamyl-phosphate reductase
MVNPDGQLDDVDIVFMCGRRETLPQQLHVLNLNEDIRVVDLSGCHNLDHGADKPWTYGMGEMQRRILMHDARLVTVPGNAAMASLLALMPMARNLLLNSPITLHVAMGTTAFPEEGDRNADGYDTAQWIKEQQQEITLALSQCQTSFNQPIDLTITPLAERRTLAVAARFSCGIDDEMIRQLYEQYYSDHNFVFLVDRPIVAADVENTNKCLIRLDKDERKGLLTVHAVMDLLLKGGAGTAVHAMNLLFGLHERAGLALKATGC